MAKKQRKKTGGSFKCRLCSFAGKSVPSLNIHMGRMHGEAKKKRRTTKKVDRRPGRTTRLSNLSLAELADGYDAYKAELKKRLSALI